MAIKPVKQPVVSEDEKVEKKTYRFTACVDEETFQTVTYWAKTKKITVNDLLRDAIDYYIAYQNKNYDLPTLEIQRLNQLVDVISVLSSDINSLEKVVTSGFDSLTSLTRGDNYLLDEKDVNI